MTTGQRHHRPPPASRLAAAGEQPHAAQATQPPAQHRSATALPRHHDVVTELRASGLAPTMQRRIVLTALEGRQHPASVIEIHEQLRKQGHPVGLTTVYRTVHALAEVGLVHVFHRDGKQTYRHCRQPPHQHLVCERCGVVVEHPADPAAEWLRQVRAESDFSPDPQHSDLYGVCGTCLRTSRHHHPLDHQADRHDPASEHDAKQEPAPHRPDWTEREGSTADA